ncbi:TIGR02206 family membrane protein [Pseudalkalibacillus sp. SCS-8]|uniref:YwaF family protein n=1 Tax=Pseudalkalibacillus nanhaiensis TaxID=3115291 RepID=UPI0032DA9188
MGTFFYPELYRNFTLFSTSHFIMISVLTILIVTLFLFGSRIRKNTKYQHHIRWTLFTVLVLSELSYQLWSLMNGVWDLRIHLPFHLCSISSLAILYFLLKPNESRFQLVYFIAFLPPVLAIVTPDLLYGYPHYRFFQFFIHHMTLVVTVFYAILILRLRPKFASIFKAVFFINILALPLHYLNRSIGSNYLFLEGPPASDTLLSWFGTGYWYIINLEIVMFVAFLITYLPFMSGKIKAKKEVEM